MPLENFQCVVLGDEPAGLWLLRRLAQTNESQQLGWIRLSQSPSPTAVPVPLVTGFGLELGPSWSAEILTPSASLVWENSTLQETFPELPKEFSRVVSTNVGRSPLSTPHLAAVRYAIRHRPELLTYASGLWKLLGRAQKLHPETLVAGALLCTELAWWEPHAFLPSDLKTIRLSPLENPIEEAHLLKNGKLAITFQGHDPIASEHWILNAPWRHLLSLNRKSRDLLSRLNEQEDLRSQHALCGLRLRVGREAVPCTMRPLTVSFNTNDIPDPLNEIRNIELHESQEGEKELVLWVSVPRELSLDTTLDKFREGMKQLNHLLPSLPGSVIHLSVPLTMESCFSEAHRASAIALLEEAFIEHYAFTALQTQTRTAGFYILPPSIHCHLPYPIGPLYAARRLLEEIAGRQKTTRVSTHVKWR